MNSISELVIYLNPIENLELKIVTSVCGIRSGICMICRYGFAYLSLVVGSIIKKLKTINLNIKSERIPKPRSLGFPKSSAPK
jgi:hypothetical protein